MISNPKGMFYNNKDSVSKTLSDANDVFRLASCRTVQCAGVCVYTTASLRS